MAVAILYQNNCEELIRNMWESLNVSVATVRTHPFVHRLKTTLDKSKASPSSTPACTRSVRREIHSREHNGQMRDDYASISNSLFKTSQSARRRGSSDDQAPVNNLASTTARPAGFSLTDARDRDLKLLRKPHLIARQLLTAERLLASRTCISSTEGPSSIVPQRPTKLAAP